MGKERYSKQQSKQQQQQKQVGISRRRFLCKRQIWDVSGAKPEASGCLYNNINRSVLTAFGL